MKLVRFVLLVAGMALVLVGCGGEADPVPDTGTGTSTETTTNGTGDIEIPDDGEDLPDIGTATFSDPLNVDNPWFPLTPGTQLVFEGNTMDEGEEVHHRIVFTVTDLTKTIDGVPVVVRWDEDYSDGELVEAELAFFAQDDDGNVWHLGEYPEEYEEGEMVLAPTWLAGLEGSQAGHIMKADPQTGTPSYGQGWGPAVEWTDRGQVDAITGETCVTTGCYPETLIIAEWALEERDLGVQLKYYAKGIGNIKVGFRDNDATQEELELIEIIMLDEAGLADVRAKALALEASAYENSPDVYGETDPATPR